MELKCIGNETRSLHKNTFNFQPETKLSSEKVEEFRRIFQTRPQYIDLVIDPRKAHYIRGIDSLFVES